MRCYLFLTCFSSFEASGNICCRNEKISRCFASLSHNCLKPVHYTQNSSASTNNFSKEIRSFDRAMKKEHLIEKTARYIQQEFSHEGSGHDWWHIHRVWQLAQWIARREGASVFIVEMAALLHDLDDWKLSQPNEAKARKWMEQLGIPPNDQQTIQQVIDQVSFKGAGVDTTPDSLEARVVQDADRLDAMGAIGIARTFAYGGHKNRLIYDPEEQPVLHDSFDAYQQSTGPTINHFYEKLLLLKDRINTATGQKLARQRHQFMEHYLEQFFREWNNHEQPLTL